MSAFSPDETATLTRLMVKLHDALGAADAEPSASNDEPRKRGNDKPLRGNDGAPSAQ